MQRLPRYDLLALGFMTFALFLGAGNIIFPPSVGLAAGDQVWHAALGFLLTGVGLPLLTVVALALYSLAYFALVVLLALNPGQLVERIGKWITPVLLAALLVLGGAAVLAPLGDIAGSSPSYQQAPVLQGVVQGYLTMDTLGALVFGIVIASAIRSRGIRHAHLVTRYAVLAGVMAAVGLSLVYLSLFYLGATSQGLLGSAQNGVQILSGYVQLRFGLAGSLLLAVVISLACLTTAVGLLTACGEYFSSLLGYSYRTVVLVLAMVSLGLANQGLTQLIQVSVPVLVGLYPLAIVLVVLSLASGFWREPRRVFMPVMAVTLVFAVLDGLRSAGLVGQLPVLQDLPLAAESLGWLAPVALTLLLAAMLDRARGMPQRAG